LGHELARDTFDREKEGDPIILFQARSPQAQNLRLRWDIPDKPSSSPCVGVVALIPVDAVFGSQSLGYRVKFIRIWWNSQSLAACNTGMGCPGATQHDVMFTIKEISRVTRIGFLRRKAFPLFQGRTSPLPHATKVTLTTQPVAIMCDCCRSPIFESHIAAR
jgi:hypothetical protein